MEALLIPEPFTPYARLSSSAFCFSLHLDPLVMGARTCHTAAVPFPEKLTGHSSIAFSQACPGSAHCEWERLT